MARRDKQFYIDRAVTYAKWMLENDETTTGAARHFNVSESTVGHCVKEWLPKADEDLDDKIKQHYKKNKVKGLNKINSLSRVVVECDSTCCKFNDANSRHDIGHCTLSKICITFKEIKDENGEGIDTFECENFHYTFKGKGF